MSGQIRQPDGQNELFGRATETRCRDDCERNTDKGTYWEERPPHEGDAQRP
jgi:hypothetical protein